jgi:beta-glucosidase
VPHAPALRRRYVTSDCGALAFLVTAQHYSANDEDAAVAALTAGCDLECTCCGFGNVTYTLPTALAGGRVNMSQIDTALSRALRSRFELGALDPFGYNPYDTLTAAAVVDSPAHRALALDAAQQVIVLLTNDGTLPLGPAPASPADEVTPSAQPTLCVFGPNANSTSAMLGDYAPKPTFTVTLLQGITQRAAAAGYGITYLQACGDMNCTTVDPAVGPAAATCAASVVTMGLTAAGACGCPVGDAVEGECCDRTDVALPGRVGELIATVAAASPRTVVVSINGGMVDLSPAVANPRVNAILHATYPGEYAGTAVAGALFGDFSPAGRLPTTWYSDFAATVPAMENYTMANRTYRFHAGPFLFPFGHGLSYTTFRYSGLSVSPGAGPACSLVTVNVTVANTGAMDAAEVVQVYATISNASVPVPLRQLVGFTRVFIPAGAIALVSFTLQPRQWSVLRAGDYAEQVEPGTRFLTVGGGQPGDNVAPVLSATFNVTGPVTPFAACAAVPGVVAFGNPMLPPAVEVVVG